MGIYLLPYGVKLEKVKAAFKFSDEKLLEEIKKTSVYDCYASQGGGRSVSTEQALRQMIFGEEYDKTCADTYGYALIALVAYWGENLTPEGDVFKIGSVNEGIEQVLANYGISINFGGAMLSEFYNFDLPRNPDFPVIGGISKDSLEYYQKELEKVNISAEDLKDPAKEEAMIFKRAVNYCVEHDLEWVTFAH